MGHDECPFCGESYGVVEVAGCDDVLHCLECGAYFDAEDDEEGCRDKSSHHRQRMRREGDDD